MLEGNCYPEGKGVEKDRKEAEKWLKMAAEQDNDMAGIMLQELENGQ